MPTVDAHPRNGMLQQSIIEITAATGTALGRNRPLRRPVVTGNANRLPPRRRARPPAAGRQAAAPSTVAPGDARHRKHWRQISVALALNEEILGQFLATRIPDPLALRAGEGAAVGL